MADGAVPGALLVPVMRKVNGIPGPSVELDPARPLVFVGQGWSKIGADCHQPQEKCQGYGLELNEKTVPLSLFKGSHGLFFQTTAKDLNRNSERIP